MKSTNNKDIKSLEDYFINNYYQESCGAMEATYTEDETFWKQSAFDMDIAALCEVSKPKSVLEFGCGEGFMLNAFHTMGCEVHGVDLSLYGLEKQNPHLLEYCTAASMDDYILENDLIQYDTICIMQSIQYIVDPTQFLKTVLSKTSDDVTIMMSIPNNNSTLEQYAKEKGCVQKDFSPRTDYFNELTLEISLEIVRNVGLKVESKSAIWPIEFNFLNANSNHTIDQSRGKNNHHARVLTHNFLYKQNKMEYFNILKSFGEIGVGRAILLICKRA